MKYKLSVYNILEFGQRIDAQGNPHQEDSIFPAFNRQKDTDRLFVLCDGMGGHDAGEVASATVCEAISNSVFRNAPDPEGEFTDEILLKAIDDAFIALDEHDNGAEKKMGTTMTFLKFHDKGCTIAHMGDSRVYHIRPGKSAEDTKILFVTEDHSLVNDLVKIGELTKEEAKTSRQKNVITRAMQPKMERRPKADIYHTSDIRPGDYFYMCSDGMLEQMEDDNLCFNFSEKTGDDNNKVTILINATNQNKDNHSAIIVHVLDVIDPLPPVSDKPAVPAPFMAEVEESEPAPALASEPEYAPVQPQRPVNMRNDDDDDDDSRRSGGIWIWLLVVAALVLCGLVGWYLYNSKKNENNGGNKAKTEEVRTPESGNNNRSPKVEPKSSGSKPAPSAPKKEESKKNDTPQPPKEETKPAPESAPGPAVSPDGLKEAVTRKAEEEKKKENANKAIENAGGLTGKGASDKSNDADDKTVNSDPGKQEVVKKVEDKLEESQKPKSQPGDKGSDEGAVVKE